VVVVVDNYYSSEFKVYTVWPGSTHSTQHTHFSGAPGWGGLTTPNLTLPDPCFFSKYEVRREVGDVKIAYSREFNETGCTNVTSQSANDKEKKFRRIQVLKVIFVDLR
jgi:hypothetical protein